MGSPPRLLRETQTSWPCSPGLPSDPGHPRARILLSLTDVLSPLHPRPETSLWGASRSSAGSSVSPRGASRLRPDGRPSSAGDGAAVTRAQQGALRAGWFLGQGSVLHKGTGVRSSRGSVLRAAGGWGWERDLHSVPCCVEDGADGVGNSRRGPPE